MLRGVDFLIVSENELKDLQYMDKKRTRGTLAGKQLEEPELDDKSIRVIAKLMGVSSRNL